MRLRKSSDKKNGEVEKRNCREETRRYRCTERLGERSMEEQVSKVWLRLRLGVGMFMKMHELH